MVSDEKILQAMIKHGGKVVAVADEVGLKRDGVYKRISTPQFKAMYNEANKQVLQEVIAAIQSGLTKGVDEVNEIIDDFSTPPQVKVNAVQMLLNAYCKYNELYTLTERVEALERATEGVNNG